MRLALPRGRFRRDTAGVPHVAAAPVRGVTVQNFAPHSRHRYPYAIPRARHGCEVHHHNHHIVRVPGAAEEAHDAVVDVVNIDPLEAFPSEVDLVQGRFGIVDMVQGCHIFAQLAMMIEPEQRPVELRVEIPFTPLPDLRAPVSYTHLTLP